jgi:hypothetical protein
MSTNPLLIGGLVVVGGASLWALYKAWQAKQQSASQQYCAGVCGTDAACLAACAAAEGIVDAIGTGLSDINPISDSGTEWETGLQKDIASNNALNGAIAVPNDIAGSLAGTPRNPLLGPALQYVNGCQPYFDAPGWVACAAGTVDMYSDGVISRHGGTSSDTTMDYAGEAGEVTPLALPQPKGLGLGYAIGVNSDNSINEGTVVVQPINKNNFMTGAQGDPTTFGPFGPYGSPYMMMAATTDDGTEPGTLGQHTLQTQTTEEQAEGPFTWQARGTRVTCPSGQVPKTIQLGALGIANPDPIGTEACVSSIAGADLCVNGAPPPGLTWNPSAGVWVKWSGIGAQNPGPCATQTGTGGVGLGGDITGVIGGSNGVTAGGGGLQVNASSSQGMSSIGATASQSKTVAGQTGNLILGTFGSATIKYKTGSLV